MNINNWKKFNELNRGTYFSAANKIYSKQPNRTKRLRDHGSSKGIYENPFIPKYKFDIYLGFIVLHDPKPDEEEEYYPKEIIKNVKIEDYFERYDTNSFAITFDLTGTKYDGRTVLTAEVQFDEDNYENVQIRLFDDSNKFINKRSAIQFMKLLHRLYEFHNLDKQRKVMSKISGTKTTPLTYEDAPNNNFWGYLNEHNCDWNKFKSKININDLWDHYD